MRIDRNFELCIFQTCCTTIDNFNNTYILHK